MKCRDGSFKYFPGSVLTVTLTHTGRALDEVVDSGVRQAEKVSSLALSVDHLRSQATIDLLQQLCVTLINRETPDHVEVCVVHNLKPAIVHISLQSQ